MRKLDKRNLQYLGMRFSTLIRKRILRKGSIVTIEIEGECCTLFIGHISKHVVRLDSSNVGVYFKYSSLDYYELAEVRKEFHVKRYIFVLRDLPF